MARFALFGTIAHAPGGRHEAAESPTDADLHDLYRLACGIAERAGDSSRIAAFAESTLARIVAGRVRVLVGEEAPGALLERNGRTVGTVVVEHGDDARWSRIRERVVPQLAGALDAAVQLEECRQTDLNTISTLRSAIARRNSLSTDEEERVATTAVALARRLGYSGGDLDAIRIGALIHDIGRISIPESIVDKPGPLDNDEWVVMKRHPVLSELILSENGLSPVVLEIARSSHERIDGLGYPDGLAGEAIPLPARIVFVADAFDALTTDRPYRRARRPRAALQEIMANSGTQFCPRVVGALERLFCEEPAVLGEIGLTVVASA
jgi:putative nucleotidyltransferase with HDIG domain